MTSYLNIGGATVKIKIWRDNFYATDSKQANIKYLYDV